QLACAENGSPRLPVITYSFEIRICSAAQGLSTGSRQLPTRTVTWPAPSWFICWRCSGSGGIGPRNPADGGSHSGRMISHAKVLEASSGILPLGAVCAAAALAQRLRPSVRASAACGWWDDFIDVSSGRSLKAAARRVSRRYRGALRRTHNPRSADRYAD